MSNLHVSIDRTTKTARFFGRGTFEAKEEIKRIGQARFNSAEKVWEVRGFELSAEDLLAIFPGILIEECSFAAVDAVINGLANAAPAALSEAVEDLFPPLPGAISEPAIRTVPDGVSVSEFLNRARAVLKGAFPKTVYIYGVLSQVKPRADRIFMELKESEERDDRVKCIIWESAERKCAELKRAGFQLEPGLQVMFEVSVGLNRAGGEVSLTVERIVAEYTLGKLAAQREVTNERLKKEGIFATNKQLALPFLPRRFGVLTSAGGTVINDFMASLNDGKFGFELLWYSASVQGAAAKQSLLTGLTTLSELPDLDAILIFRGGGSPAELAIFNDYEIAKAVCLCPIPVLSAIGHESDQSSVQDVSFRAFGVPKDLGHFFAQMILDFRKRFERAQAFIRTVAGSKVEHSEQTVSLLAQKIVHALRQSITHREEACGRMQQLFPLLGATLLKQSARHFSDLLAPFAALGNRATELRVARLNALAHQISDRSRALHQACTYRLERFSQIPREAERILEQRAARAQSLAELIEGAAPETQLRRGFALVRSADGERLVTSGAALEKGEQVEIQFHDTGRKATIE
ncbi:MAG: exodeoxyribonuclease VII large subunit [Bdellovibrionota bacterium]